MKSTSSFSSTSAKADVAPTPPIGVRIRWRVPVLVAAVAAGTAAMNRRLPSIRLVPIAPGLSANASSILVTVLVGFVVLCVVVACIPSYVFPVAGKKTTNNSSTRIKGNSAEEENGSGETEFVVPPVRIKDSVNGVDGGGKGAAGASPPFVLSSDLAQQVAERVLPARLADYTWIRVYSLSRDGDSFVSFLKAVENLECTLLVLRTQKGSVVGAFADSSWSNAAKGPAAFRGGPKTSLFRVSADNSSVTRQPSRVECYAWTGANMYCQLCDVRRRRIAFGCGSGGDDDNNNNNDQTKGSSSFGLTLERDFLTGTTSTCPTFNNPPLCEDHFAIVELEVFGFRLW
jgi:TLD